MLLWRAAFLYDLNWPIFPNFLSLCLVCLMVNLALLMNSLHFCHFFFSEKKKHFLIETETFASNRFQNLRIYFALRIICFSKDINSKRQSIIHKQKRKYDLLWEDMIENKEETSEWWSTIYRFPSIFLGTSLLSYFLTTDGKIAEFTLQEQLQILELGTIQIIRDTFSDIFLIFYHRFLSLICFEL